MTQALVVGAGVIGLTTAVCLAEAGHDVKIVTEQGPLQTASGAASGLWVPGYTSQRELDWSLVSFAEFSAMLTDPHAGVRLCRGLGMTDLFDTPQEFHNHLPDLRVLSPEERPDRFSLGWWSTVPLIDMTRYLAYLARRFTTLGGTITQGVVRDLEEVYPLAPLVINATGVGARSLAGDEEVYPVRGQHVVVRDPGIGYWYMEGVEAGSWAGFFPHGNKVLLAGVSQRDNWSVEPSATDAEEILERCIEVEPKLKGAEVLGQRVGLRAARSSARLEEEQVGSTTVIHCYGHGGFGVSQSWGCGRAIAQMVSPDSAVRVG